MLDDGMMTPGVGSLSSPFAVDVPGVLDGVRVLDFTRVVAGPCATRVLADLGAEVIKVEPPEGDILRTGWPRRGGISLLYSGQNVGKRFCAVDLSHAEGVELCLALAERCDVVIENFRPGVAARLGVGYDQVRARKADIVYCSVSGYGQDGRDAQRRAYAPVVHAEVGLLSYKAQEWECAPLPEPVAHADIAAGMAAAQGVLAALFRRERTGQGAYIDASMCEAMIAQNEWTAIEINGGADYERSPFRPGKAALVQVGDGTWVTIPGSPTAVLMSCLGLWGRTDLVDDPRFATMAARNENVADCEALISEFAATFPDAEAFERCLSEGARLPVGVVRTIPDTLASAWAVDRDAYVTVPSGDAEMRINRSALRIDGTGCGPRGGAKHLGADNADVFGTLLGISPTRVAELTDQGVLAHRTSDD